MICAQCLKSPQDGRSRREAQAVDRPMADRLSTVLCERCNAVLSPDDASDRLLRKLVVLAGFGLAAGGGPILKP